MKIGGNRKTEKKATESRRTKTFSNESWKWTHYNPPLFYIVQISYTIRGTTSNDQVSLKMQLDIDNEPYLSKQEYMYLYLFANMNFSYSVVEEQVPTDGHALLSKMAQCQIEITSMVLFVST